MVTINDIDKNLTDALFIAKADNIFVMLCSSIMKWDLTRVDHKIGDDLYNHYLKITEELKSKNQRQMFDELNVKSTHITNIYEDDNKYYVEVKLVSGYMDYIMDATTNKLISGNNSYRSERTNILTFEKRKDATELGAVRRCKGCSNPMDISNNGKCEYCGRIFDTEDYDFVLVKHIIK